jgi:hypothetical protein
VLYKKLGNAWRGHSVFPSQKFIFLRPNNSDHGIEIFLNKWKNILGREVNINVYKNASCQYNMLAENFHFDIDQVAKGCSPASVNQVSIFEKILAFISGKKRSRST